MPLSIVKEAFCAKCQAVTKHDFTRDKHNEIVATCTTADCNRFLKIPMGVSATELEQILDAHHKANAGQVTVEVAAEGEEAADRAFKSLMGMA